MNDDISQDGDALDIGDIAVACALGYLDLRISDYSWREDFADLAKWYETVAARPAMVETAPKA